MKGFRLFKIGEPVARQIDDELRFHLDSLTEEYLRQQMPAEEARDAAARRLGDVEQIRKECLAISKRSRPYLVALKTFLILMFLAGVGVRIPGTDVNIHHLGDLMIAVPLLGRLLLYVRGLNPSSFLSKPETASPLRLNENPQPLFTVYDQGMLTPVERLISDK